MLEKKYRLLKNLPDAKAGQHYIYNKSYNRYYLDGNVLGSYWDIEYVQDNPEWFELVTEPSIAPERITVKHLSQHDYVNNDNRYKDNFWYQLEVTKPLWHLNNTEVMKKIENVLNDTPLQQVQEDKPFLLKDFIERFVGKNTTIRLWNKCNGGHKQVDGDNCKMEWELLKSKYANMPFLYVKDIIVLHTSHSEALNVVIEDVDNTDLLPQPSTTVKDKESMSADWRRDNLSTVKDNKGWEIQCLVVGDKNYWLQKNKLYHCHPFETEYTAEQIMNWAIFSHIHSVKRLSDNCVFSIGDKITWGCTGIYETTLTGFFIKDGRLKFDDEKANGRMCDFLDAINLQRLPPKSPTDTPQQELMYNISSMSKIHSKNDLCESMGCVKYDERIHGK